MEQLFDLFSRNSEQYLNILINGFWPGLVFTALVWLIVHYARRLDAASRYRMWSVALLFVAVTPILASPVPGTVKSWVASVAEHFQTENNAPAPAASQITFAVATYDGNGQSAKLEPSNDNPNPNSSTAGTSATADRPHFVRFDFPGHVSSDSIGKRSLDYLAIAMGMIPISVISLWILISCFFMFRIFRGYLAVRGIKRSMVPLTTGNSLLVIDTIVQANARRKATVGMSPIVQVPVSIGFFHPVIIFPEHLIDRLNSDEIRSITLHELAHIQRYDDWMNLLQRSLQAVFFFHPAVILIGSKMNLEREIACDEWVVENTGQPREYARTLTRLVQLAGDSFNPVLASGAALFKKQIYKRLEKIVAGHKLKKLRLSRFRTFAIFGILVLAVALLVQVTPVIALPGEAVRYRELSRTIQEGWREASAYIPGLIYDDQLENSYDDDRYHASNDFVVPDIAPIAPIRGIDELALLGRESEHGEGLDRIKIITPLPDAKAPVAVYTPGGRVAVMPNTKNPVVWVRPNSRETQKRYGYRYNYIVNGEKLDYDLIYTPSADPGVAVNVPSIPDSEPPSDFFAPDVYIEVPDFPGTPIAINPEGLAELAAKQADLGEAVKEQYYKNAANAKMAKKLKSLTNEELQELYEAQADLYADLNENWVTDLASAAGDFLSDFTGGNNLTIGDDDHITWKYNDDGHKIRIEVEGNIEFTDDDRWIKELESGGFISIYERYRGDTRKFEAENVRGEMRYTYELDGTERDLDSEGREWVGEMLLKMVRRSGIGAEARVRRFYDKGGVDAVLEEIYSLESDYVSRIYFNTLFENELTNDDLLKSLDMIDRIIDSDYEKAELLISISDRCGEDDELLKGYIKAVTALDSDYETRRVLSAVSLENINDSKTMEMAMEIAMNMDSDYEKAEYLIDLARANDNNFDLSSGYIKAINSLDSDYERGRVLKTLIKSGEISADYLSDIIRLADFMDSDYERAELLIYTAQRLGTDGDLFGIYVDAIGSMSSDYDKRRTLTALGYLDRADEGSVIKVLNVIELMGADYDRAELLIDYGHESMATEESRKAFLRAVDAIDSDYDRGRVIHNAMRGDEVPKDFIIGALILIEDMTGDYEKSQLLDKLTEYCLDDAELEQACARAIETISSSYEKDKLFAELYQGKYRKN